MTTPRPNWAKIFELEPRYNHMPTTLFCEGDVTILQHFVTDMLIKVFDNKEDSAYVEIVTDDPENIMAEMFIQNHVLIEYQATQGMGRFEVAEAFGKPPLGVYATLHEALIGLMCHDLASCLSIDWAKRFGKQRSVAKL